MISTVRRVSPFIGESSVNHRLWGLSPGSGEAFLPGRPGGTIGGARVLFVFGI
jgi:hypothetical protein